MNGRVVLLEENAEVEVKLSADDKGQVTLGIRINGSDERVLAQTVAMPDPRSTKSWTTTIGEVM